MNDEQTSSEPCNPTEKLYQLSTQPLSYTSLDTEEVQRLVDGGADINYIPPAAAAEEEEEERDSTSRSTLSSFFFSHPHPPVAVILACLKTTREIDFTSCHHLATSSSSSPSRQTILHRICSNCFSSAEATSILQAIVTHIQQHPGDTVDWGAEDDYECTFIVRAAENQRLSLFYPLVRHFTFFHQKESSLPFLSCAIPLLRRIPFLRNASLVGHSAAPIPLKTVWSWDWEALEEQDKTHFNTDRTETVEASRPTGELSWMAQQAEDSPHVVDVEEVKRLVSDGADVLFRPEVFLKPTLMAFAYKGCMEALRACLETSSPIDFTLTDHRRRTLFHYLCCDFSPTTAAEILQLLVYRVETHPRDQLDWGQEDMAGLDFIHLAAENGRLSLLFPLVRQMAYFDDRTEPITLDTVRAADWKQLSEEDKENFTVLEEQEEEEDE